MVVDYFAVSSFKGLSSFLLRQPRQVWAWSRPIDCIFCQSTIRSLKDAIGGAEEGMKGPFKKVCCHGRWLRRTDLGGCLAARRGKRGKKPLAST